MQLFKKQAKVLSIFSCKIKSNEDIRNNRQRNLLFRFESFPILILFLLVLRQKWLRSFPFTFPFNPPSFWSLNLVAFYEGVFFRVPFFLHYNILFRDLIILLVFYSKYNRCHSLLLNWNVFLSNFRFHIFWYFFIVCTDLLILKDT